MSFEGVTTDKAAEKQQTNGAKVRKTEFQLLCEEIQSYQEEMEKLESKVADVKERAALFDQFQEDLEKLREKSGSAVILRNKLARIEEKMDQILKIGKKFNRLNGVDFNPGDSIMSRHDFCLMLGRTGTDGVKKPIAYNTMVRFVKQNPDLYELIKMGSGRHGLTFIRIKAQIKVA